MKTDRLAKHISTAQEALRSFLATLLGGEAPLLVEEPTTADFDDANMRSKANIVFTAGTSQENQWAVALDPEWLPLLSKSMLGEPIEFGEPGADDLLRELAAQAYGAIRTQLHSAGVALAEAEIELLERGKELGSNKFGPILYEIPFRITIDNQKLRGYAIIPYFDDEPAQTAARPEPFEIPNVAPQTAPAEQPQQRQASIQVASASFPELGNEVLGGDGMDSGFALLAEVELEVTVELGRRKIPLSDVLRLTTGSVIELEKLVGEPLEVYANGRLIAEGEAVVMDEQFGIRITNLASNRPRAKAFV